jgi:nuclear RNA export factor
LIQEICPDVQTISLAENELNSLASLSTLSTRIPGLINISFKNNAIRSLAHLEHIGGKSFVQLRELILEGNPIKERDMQREGGEINYKSSSKSDAISESPFIPNTASP